MLSMAFNQIFGSHYAKIGERFQYLMAFAFLRTQSLRINLLANLLSSDLFMEKAIKQWIFFDFFFFFYSHLIVCMALRSNGIIDLKTEKWILHWLWIVLLSLMRFIAAHKNDSTNRNVAVDISDRNSVFAFGTVLPSCTIHPFTIRI